MFTDQMAHCVKETCQQTKMLYSILEQLTAHAISQKDSGKIVEITSNPFHQ